MVFMIMVFTYSKISIIMISYNIDYGIYDYGIYILRFQSTLDDIILNQLNAKHNNDSNVIITIITSTHLAIHILCTCVYLYC